MTFEDRFWAKVVKTDDCWLWIGAKTGDGYGQMQINSRKHYAHRLSFTMAGGLIPVGMCLDHLCSVRNCVRPDHLQAVTLGVNTMRGRTIAATNASKTHCVNGHPFDLLNTRAEGSRRTCRACGRDQAKRAYQRRLQADAA